MFFLMAVLLLYFHPSRLFARPCSLSSLFPAKCHGGAWLEMVSGRRGRKRKRKTGTFVVCSTHSNARIIKLNRRTPYGQMLSPYVDEEDEDSYRGQDSEEESEFSDDEYEERTELRGGDRKSLSLSSNYGTNLRQGNSSKQLVREEMLANAKHDAKRGDGSLSARYGMSMAKIKYGDSYAEVNCNRKMKGKKSGKSAFYKFSEDLGFDEKWFPLIEYLSTFGLKESHFIQIYERHMPCLQVNVASAQERLEFLLGVGVRHRDVRKILLRQPQILEYTVENNLQPHVSFLLGLGIPDGRVGQIITAAPSLFSYSVEQSLKPTVRYLIEEVGIQKSDVSKVVQLSPQILVQRIDNSWTSRFGFLSKELGAPRDSIVKMVTKHPQLLHYSIEDGILPRINFLRSIGMRNSDILKVLTRLTQVLSLSLEDNLRPKYLYLVNELHNEVKSLTKYPMYLSLSLEQRIRPRHKYLVALKKAPKGPFPLSSLVPTDECFCQQWAGTSLENYLAFRQSLLLSRFAKKYERK